MANIQPYLDAIMAAVYGEDVRGSIHDAIDIINQVSEVVLSTGTAITGPTSSSSGFFEGSLYINTNTEELWKCIGTDSWVSQGTLRGTGISSIVKTSSVGLVDTYTITYTDTTTSTFAVTNGQDGTIWYRGTYISGKSPTPTVYPLSGITKANAGDFYLNPNEGAIYYCVTGGNAATATWSYDFTMTGGGGAQYLDDLTDVVITSGTLADGQILTYDDNAKEWVNKEPDKSFVRYGGALNFSDLATYASTYLTAAYEDTFFLLRTGGTIGTGEASAYWSSNFTDGNVIPADAHIAVINVNRGTMNPASYKYDDFGGFVDISGKADKTELDDFLTPVTQANGKATFTGLTPSHGYSLFMYSPDANNTETTITPPSYTSVKKTISSAGVMTLEYTISGGTDGTTQWTLRVDK